MTPEQEALVLDNLKLVHYMVNSYSRGRSIPPNVREELDDEAQLALVEAAVSYDPGKGKFSSWACLMITQHITKYLKSLKLFSVGKSMDDQSLFMPKRARLGTEYRKRQDKKERLQKRISESGLIATLDAAAFRRGWLARSGVMF
jgi:DNA-directed RNA polymerase specialized sigma subunit